MEILDDEFICCCGKHNTMFLLIKKLQHDMSEQNNEYLFLFLFFHYLKDRTGRVFQTLAIKILGLEFGIQEQGTTKGIKF